MRSTRFVIGVTLLGLALVSFLLGLTRLSFHIGATEVNAYLGLFLALVGLGLVVRPGADDRPRRGRSG
jgi:hypothetical protein